MKRAALLLLHRLRTGRKIALIVLDNVVWRLLKKPREIFRGFVISKHEISARQPYQNAASACIALKVAIYKGAAAWRDRIEKHLLR
ncbi:hypothetical protein SAMN02744765_4106 [Pantoea agglomerans]|nr:hypothetical protein SAMN02744765_4106 [Pantoea agglomerans]